MTHIDWFLPPQHPSVRQNLVAAGYAPLLAAVLASRGVTTVEDANHLLEIHDGKLANPMLMRDMEKANARIRHAVEQNEYIAVYGDYDVDGITSTTLLTDFLRGLGAAVFAFIPHRMEDGYGLNAASITALAQKGIQLIITVDCGITAVSEVEVAKSLGVDIIITDHHGCKEDLPDAVAVVNPHRADCPYPFKELAGVGVALKLALALAGEQNRETVLNRYASLVAVGTIADVMPMVGENRILVRRGLAQIENAPQMGLRLLIEESGLGEKPITTVGIGYTLAPRLNASGRMGCADIAVELLLTENVARGRELSAELCELNRQRQGVEADILAECVARLEKEPQEGIILLADDQWHQGVVGIVASRLAERYGCPTFIVCLSDGRGKGSCRSFGGVNLFALLRGGEHLLEGFGGHALAAGLTVTEENIPALAQYLRENVANYIETEEGSGLNLDCDASPAWITVEQIGQLDLLEPCGNGNPRPSFCLHHARIITAAAVGQGRHLKLRLERDGIYLDAIWFSAGGEDVHAGDYVDVAFHPQINEFRGARNPQLQIIDLRVAEEEDAIYHKFVRGEALSPYEVEQISPQRPHFIRLWRYLQQCATQQSPVLTTVQRLADDTLDGARPRTRLCLDVLVERGLISLTRQTGQLSIALNHLEHKVDLEDSSVLRPLQNRLL